jgi:hypothetical protein
MGRICFAGFIRPSPLLCLDIVVKKTLSYSIAGITAGRSQWRSVKTRQGNIVGILKFFYRKRHSMYLIKRKVYIY